jgi:hypothetical protein
MRNMLVWFIGCQLGSFLVAAVAAHFFGWRATPGAIVALIIMSLHILVPVSLLFPRVRRWFRYFIHARITAPLRKITGGVPFRAS